MEEILTSTTNTDQVRSLLGVSENDISDKNFDTESVELELTTYLELESIDYTTIIAEATASGATPAQIKSLNYLKLFSMYYCAVLIIPRLKLIAKQKVSDGENTMERFLSPDFSKFEDKYSSKLAVYETALKDNLSGGTTVNTLYSPLSGVAPTYDPVTGS